MEEVDKDTAWVEEYREIYGEDSDEIKDCKILIEENRQLAEWLMELKELKATDVQPVKRGQWFECYTDSHHYSGICSVCGKASIRKLQEKPYEFCPRCGADMKEN